MREHGMDVRSLSSRQAAYYHMRPTYLAAVEHLIRSSATQPAKILERL